MKIIAATNLSTDFFAMLREWEHDTLPELAPPRDYAEYERAVCEQQALGMHTRYVEPIT